MASEAEKTEKAYMAELKDAIGELKKATEYDTPTTEEALQKLERNAYGTIGQVKKFGDFLAENGFAELVVKMKRWYNEKGVFSSQETWSCCKSIIYIAWNCTGRSDRFCLKLFDEGYLKLMLADLNHTTYREQYNTSEHVRTLLNANLSTLYNCSKLDTLKTMMREADVTTTMGFFLNSELKAYKIVGTLVLSEIMSEEENLQMAAADDVVTGAMLWMIEAVDSESRQVLDGIGGFYDPIEIITGVAHLSANEANKKKIMAADALPCIKKAIATDAYEEEQIMTIRIVANLAFDKEARATLLADEELMGELNRLAGGTNAKAKKAANSALWIINDRTEQAVAQAEKTAPKTKEKGHIMISYNWEDQKTLLKVCEHLKEAGHKVWMDVDKMSGSTVEAMAKAVEDSYIVLMCASEKYKNSYNCRIEAEYAFKLQKNVVPLMMHKGYKPDGWLGILMGTKLFVDFTGKYELKESLKRLTTQVGRLIDGGEEEQSSPSDPDKTSSKKEKKEKKEKKSAAASAAGAVLQWTSSDVSKWLKDNKLEQCADKFASIDGPKLTQIAYMRNQAPQCFFKKMDQMGIDFANVLQLSFAVSELP